MTLIDMVRGKNAPNMRKLINLSYPWFGAGLICILVLGLWFNQGWNAPSDSFVEVSQRLDELSTQDLSVLTVAGGCFWCMEAAFEPVDGVVEVISGYAGGRLANPTYQQVVSGATQHREAAQIYYDASRVGLSELLDLYWDQIDPTDAGGQFSDRGFSYTTALFYQSSEEQQTFEASKLSLSQSGEYNQPIATQILPFTTFYPAEDYHQDYYKNHQRQYQTYERFSGR